MEPGSAGTQPRPQGFFPLFEGKALGTRLGRCSAVEKKGKRASPDYRAHQYFSLFSPNAEPGPRLSVN